MYILAIETTGPIGSVAIIDQQGDIIMETSTEEMNHLKDLMPMTTRLMDKLSIKPKDLTAVAASVGPGSFTGIRIGVSTARAISQALDIPCVPVPTLELFKSYCDGTKTIVPVFNARRGQVYGGVFSSSGQEILKPGPYMLEEILAMPQVAQGAKEICFYGDGVDAYKDRLAGYQVAPEEERYQTAAMVASHGLSLYRQGRTVKYNHLLPEYMRVTEAEQKLKDGSLARERAAKMARFKAK